MRLLWHIARQLRHHAPRMHGIAQNPLLRILHHDEFCKFEDRKLARLIRAAARPQRQRTHRAQIHNRL